jgi:hypothetical protein
LSLTPGAEVVSRKAGIYSYFRNNWDQAQDLYDDVAGSVRVSKHTRCPHYHPCGIDHLGFGLDRNAIVRVELDAAIAAAENVSRPQGNSGEKSIVASLKSRLHRPGNLSRHPALHVSIKGGGLS